MGEENEFMRQLAAQERARRLKVVMIALVALAVLGGAGWFFAQSRGGLGLNISAEEGAREIEEETNDPVCRGIIADVREVDQDWRGRAPRFEEHVLGEDEGELEQLKETARAFRSRMEQIKGRIPDAVLRERESKQQMRDWFGFQDNELRILEEMAERQLAIQRGEEVEEPEGLWVEPEKLRDQVLLQMDENFQEFRVWVSAGNHPCGAAPEGVEPWRSSED